MDPSNSPGIGKIAPRRRNGRPQACEPCRKRKTACDHTLPVCLRCRRRATTAACVYLKSPVAYAREQAAKDSNQPQSPTEQPESVVQRASDSPRADIAITRRSSSSTEVLKRIRPSEDLFGGRNGYLGETSFSAIFKENRANLDALPGPSSSLVASPQADGLEDVMPDHIIRMGVKILESVPDKAVAEIFMGNTLSSSPFAGLINADTWAGLAGEAVFDGFWEVWDPDTGIRHDQNHKEVVKFLCRNTSKPLEDEDDPGKWRASFSGRNMRWETIGIFFTFWAYGALASKNSDSHISSQSAPRNDSRSYMLELLESAYACISICNALEASNPLLIFLMLKHRFLESLIDGDASPTLWRRHGELISVSLAVGLHRITDTRQTLSLEWRRRVWARVFSASLNVSSFMGRPPLIGRRYVLTALPLDLDDTELMSDPATLLQAISELDVNGWGTKGKLNGVTLSRGRAMLSFIKDEILELALGLARDDVLEQCQIIKQKLFTYDSQIPDVLRWNQQEVFDDDIPSTKLAFCIIHRLEYLHGHFMTERLINKHSPNDIQTLVDWSREILSLSLNMFKHGGRFEAIKIDFEWLIMTHAVPASGVLCLILLQQQRAYGSGSMVVLPRAEVIQDLSVFVAFLDWVKPNAPNAELCYRVREIIGKVLNQALEPQQPVVEPVMDGSVPLYNFDLPDNFLGFEEFGNFDLMDTFDWVG